MKQYKPPEAPSSRNKDSSGLPPSHLSLLRHRRKAARTDRSLSPPHAQPTPTPKLGSTPDGAREPWSSSRQVWESQSWPHPGSGSHSPSPGFRNHRSPIPALTNAPRPPSIFLPATYTQWDGVGSTGAGGVWWGSGV